MPADRQPRDAELIEIESHLRVAIRDAVNQSSRKPFQWGGLAGYRQLDAIAQAFEQISETEPEADYLQRLARQVNRAVEKNRPLATDLASAHDKVREIALCLRYPPSSFADEESPALAEHPATSHQIKEAMQKLLHEFQPDLKRQPAQAALYGAWHRTWNDFGSDLLHCYDIPTLPADNLGLEALFNHLRRHQRRISGRESTRELRDFGQYQILLMAESEAELLQQFQHVPLESYQKHRLLLAEAEKPRQFLHSLHRNPHETVLKLVQQHNRRREDLFSVPSDP